MVSFSASQHQHSKKHSSKNHHNHNNTKNNNNNNNTNNNNNKTLAEIKAQYFRNCRETFSNKLEHLYACERVQVRLVDIVAKQREAIAALIVVDSASASTSLDEFERVAARIMRKIERLVPAHTRYTQLLHEEIELEIEGEQRRSSEKERERIINDLSCCEYIYKYISV